MGLDPERQVLQELIQARASRYGGRYQDAYRALDSIQFDTGAVSPMLTYSLFAQKAKVHKAMEQYDEARDFARVAQRVAARLSNQVYASNMLILLAEIDMHDGAYTEALSSFHRALTQAEAQNDEILKCQAHLGIGNVYYHQERDSLALASYRMAMASAEKGRSPGHLLDASMNAGAVMAYLNGPDASIALYDSLLINPILRQDLSTQASLLTNLASFHTDLGHHERAIGLLHEATVLCQSLGDTVGEAEARLFLASALWGIGKHQDAISEVLRAEEMAVALPLRSEANARLAEYFYKTGACEGAYKRLNAHLNMKDSLMRMRFDDRLAYGEVRFETERKERRIAEQQQALDLAASEDRRKSLQRNIFIGVAAFAALVAGLLWRLARSRRQRLEQEKELHGKTVDELLQKNEITAMHAMFEGQEKERDRVARDLHDRVGSMLGNVKMQMEVLEERMDTDQQEREGQYKKVYGLLVETVGEVRRISHDMVAGTLARFGLEKALEGLCDSVRVTGRLAVELRVFGLENRLERGVEITVYRIVQELVGNTLKHAKATELSIDVTRTPGRLSVIVADNGVGFDTSAASEGMGLANVRKRAAAIGGAITIDSTPGKGTTVSVEGPVLE